MRHIIAFLLLFSLFACKSKEPKNPKDFVNTGAVNAEKVYIDTLTGWHFKMPAEWDLVTLKESKERQEKGTRMVKEALQQNIEMDPIVRLLSMKINDRNVMEANRLPYDTLKETHPEELTTSIFQLLKATYSAKDIKYEALPGAETIDGQMFDTYSVKVLSPSGKDVLLRQELFSTLMKGNVFTITVSYNKEEEGQNMLAAVRASKFYDMKELAKADSLFQKK